ncbi:hypothetical protein [Pseudoalteromonas 'SMAR']|uniref:hypothetical protein n=1 Tax=Pseudoalteromonas 'SMAR' TaxID=3416908 RepID=UPI003AF289C5
MNPVYADILDVVPVKLNAAFAHLNPSHATTESDKLPALTLAKPLLDDIQLCVAASIRVQQSNTIDYRDNTVYLPSNTLNAAQKRQLWQQIWSAQDEQ